MQLIFQLQPDQAVDVPIVLFYLMYYNTGLLWLCQRVRIINKNIHPCTKPWHAYYLTIAFLTILTKSD